MSDTETPCPNNLNHILLHDLKKMGNDLQNLRGVIEVTTDWLEDQEIRLNEIEENINRMARRPHICPVCKGTSFDDEGLRCIPCDGKGIVWG